MNTLTSLSFTDALQQASSLSDYVIKMRRSLHLIPELGMEERKTYAFIVKAIEDIHASTCIPFSITKHKGGIVVDLEGLDKDAPYKLFRADMDGLPIEEKTGLPFASTHKGFMHACGHDAHSAMLLGYLKLVASNPDLMPRVPIRLVWQRSEERGPNYSGALMLLKEGVLDGVSHVYALHINSLGESGSFFSKPGPFLSNTGELYIEIDAQGGHVMRQDSFPSALYVANNVFLAIDTLRKSLPPQYKNSRIIPTIFQTGSAVNIRPSKAYLALAIRHYMDTRGSKALLEIIKKRISEVIRLAPKACLSRFDYLEGYSTTYNTPHEYDSIHKELNEGGAVSKLQLPLFAGEDFSYFLEQREGCYYQIGAQLGDGVDHHSPYFVIDESALKNGIAFWLFLSRRRS